MPGRPPLAGFGGINNHAIAMIALQSRGIGILNGRGIVVEGFGDSWPRADKPDEKGGAVPARAVCRVSSGQSCRSARPVRCGSTFFDLKAGFAVNSQYLARQQILRETVGWAFTGAP